MKEVLLWPLLSPEPTVLLLFCYYLTSVWFQGDTKMLCIFNNAEKYLEYPPAIPSAKRFSRVHDSCYWAVGLSITECCLNCGKIFITSDLLSGQYQAGWGIVDELLFWLEWPSRLPVRHRKNNVIFQSDLITKLRSSLRSLLLDGKSPAP